MTGVVVSFRNVVVLNRSPDAGSAGLRCRVGVVVLVIGAWVFRRWQRLFPEIV